MLLRADHTADAAVKWGASNTTAWPDSIVYSTMNDSDTGYITRFDEKIRTAIGTTTYEYTEAKGSTTVTTMSSAIFVPSVTELGLSNTNANVEGEDWGLGATVGACSNNYWSRTSYNTTGNYAAFYIAKAGTSATRQAYSNTYRIRPCFTMSGGTILDPDTLLPKEDFL